ncbi:MAG: NADH-quinone oxidoreductase subunit H [Opitutaceae bacterium]|nr:NADH-quinone oxidoreductase subunit H [Opitutaceae bacterium]
MNTALSIAVSAVFLVASLICATWARRAWCVTVVGGLFAQLLGAVLVLTSAGTWVFAGTGSFCGQRLVFEVDALSAFFLVLVAVVGGVGAVYGSGYWSESAHPRTARLGRLWWSVLLLSLDLVLLARDGVHFLLGWEVFTLAAFFLVTLDRQRSEVRRAGWLYLAASHVATLCLFAFFVLLSERTGSWKLGPMLGHDELAPLFWLALIGFGLKAGVFPLHIWLPSAHANAPSHVSAVLSGVTIKLGIYGLVRFTGWLPVPASAGWVVVALGVISAVLGVAFALGQHDLKRLLAYHSVENIGIILIGVGFGLVALGHGGAAWGGVALAGGLLHVWNHGLFKALLFLGAGSVLHATGTREMSRLGGLWRAMPWTASLFALGAAAISGLPPLNGFVSEWLVFLGLFDAAGSRGPMAWGAMPAAILLGVTGALALACFVKVCGVVFLGAPRSPAAEHAHECGPAMRGAMLVLASACAGIGLGPALVWPAVARAADAWRPGELVVARPESLTALGAAHVVLALLAGAAVWALARKASRAGMVRAVTWDCGYVAPTARMQYSAGSFAGILTEWFGWILRPAVHREVDAGVLPRAGRHASHTPETVLDQVVEPAGRLVMRLSGAVRRLQHGRVQSYILYLVAGIVALVAVVAAGTPP